MPVIVLGMRWLDTYIRQIPSRGGQFDIFPYARREVQQAVVDVRSRSSDMEDLITISLCVVSTK